MEGPETPDPHKEAAKNQAEAEIEAFKRLAEGASVEQVDTPTGRKEVEIAFSDAEHGFRTEAGTAIGVYFEPSRMNPYEVHIDWDSQAAKASDSHPQGRTSVQWEGVDTFEDSDYFTEDE